MSVPGELHELVERFDRDIPSYRSARFNEAQVRIDFINSLLDLLGWDVENRRGLPEAYREVVYEDGVKVGGGTKAPDYGFYAGRQLRFFLEAKKPSVDIQGDVNPAVQLRRYAWSARLPLSVLTDFEEFAVYDCRFEPQKDDGPATARTELFTYDRYAEEGVWEKISSVFPREAVLSGSLEKYAEENRRRRGTETVDSAFLREIEGWRDSLARDLAARNDLNQRQLNYAVQMTIDRIIFLRMAEDRGIEEYGRLLALVNGNGVYGRLRELFRDADNRFNSGLFHFRDERDRKEEPDILTPRLKIGDRLLRRIIRGLYYPESPYEFSVLPVDVLGQVYEQFLGKVIQLTRSGHRAVVEEKPEVRKAGGVYYTPTYIVDYIVTYTVGKLLEGKRPGPRGGASRLRIVDPACGSGSFLIGVYQYLLDWHRDRYLEDGPEKWPRQLYQGLGGQWHLTIDEKKRILLNNIHGVDIDPHAVEVTKLSLLLKVLEGESESSLATQLRMFQERALPDLDNNIKCGNSLIGPDFYEDEQMMLLDEEEHYRINVFDWEKSFPQVFEGDNPGFDAVIGNPPYIRMEAFKALKSYLRDNYKVHAERADLYAYFLDKGLNVLKVSGRIGMIVSNKFIRAKYGAPLRRMLSKEAAVDTIADFGGAEVFQGATVRTVVLLASKVDKYDGDGRVTYVPVPDRETLLEMANASTTVQAYSKEASYAIAPTALEGDEWQLLPEQFVLLLDHLRSESNPLHQWLGGSALFGLKTGLNEAFVIDEEKKNELIKADRTSADAIKPILFGRDVRRYFVDAQDRFVIYLHPELDVDDYPAIRDHLLTYKDALVKRAATQKWFELQQPATSLIEHNRNPKIVYPIIANECRFALDRDGYFINDKLFTLPSSDLSLLGLLNSRLANFYFGCVCAALEGVGDRYLEFRAQYVDKCPVSKRFLQWKQRASLTSLVERMLELHERLAEARIERERAVIGAQISATDRQIDRLVYELYGLTDEEIRIVEEATAR
jgi:predicted type IV restriction endonuclease